MYVRNSCLLVCWALLLVCLAPTSFSQITFLPFCNSSFLFLCNRNTLPSRLTYTCAEPAICSPGLHQVARRYLCKLSLRALSHPYSGTTTTRPMVLWVSCWRERNWNLKSARSLRGLCFTKLRTISWCGWSSWRNNEPEKAKHKQRQASPKPAKEQVRKEKKSEPLTWESTKIYVYVYYVHIAKTLKSSSIINIRNHLHSGSAWEGHHRACPCSFASAASDDDDAIPPD